MRIGCFIDSLPPRSRHHLPCVGKDYRLLISHGTIGGGQRRFEDDGTTLPLPVSWFASANLCIGTPFNL